ncbi:hypothetical protein ACLB2K_021689 [Fragaria x ananassa]
MSCLREFCVGELPPGSLSKLKVLDIRDCCDLVNELIPSKLLQLLQNVEEIICHDLRKMEYVFGFEGLEPEHIILTRLRKMRLYNQQKLLSIRKGPAPHAAFHNLRSLAVEWCTQVKYLFTSKEAQCLLHLEDLWLQSCSSLDRIIEASEETIVFPALKNFILKDLPQLTRFCSPTSVYIEFPSLEHLYVRDCPQLSTSASDFKSKNHVQLNNGQHMSSLYRREETVVSELVQKKINVQLTIWMLRLFHLLCMLPGLASQQGFADKMWTRVPTPSRSPSPPDLIMNQNLSLSLSIQIGPTRVKPVASTSPLSFFTASTRTSGVPYGYGSEVSSRGRRGWRSSSRLGSFDALKREEEDCVQMHVTTRERVILINL